MCGVSDMSVECLWWAACIAFDSVEFRFFFFFSELFFFWKYRNTHTNAPKRIRFFLATNIRKEFHFTTSNKWQCQMHSPPKNLSAVSFEIVIEFDFWHVLPWLLQTNFNVASDAVPPTSHICFRWNGSEQHNERLNVNIFETCEHSLCSDATVNGILLWPSIRFRFSDLSWFLFIQRWTTFLQKNLFITSGQVDCAHTLTLQESRVLCVSPCHIIKEIYIRIELAFENSKSSRHTSTCTCSVYLYISTTLFLSRILLYRPYRINRIGETKYEWRREEIFTHKHMHNLLRVEEDALRAWQTTKYFLPLSSISRSSLCGNDEPCSFISR